MLQTLKARLTHHKGARLREYSALLRQAIDQSGDDELIESIAEHAVSLGRADADHDLKVMRHAVELHETRSGTDAAVKARDDARKELQQFERKREKTVSPARKKRDRTLDAYESLLSEYRSAKPGERSTERKQAETVSACDAWKTAEAELERAESQFKAEQTRFHGAVNAAEQRLQRCRRAADELAALADSHDILKGAF